MQLKELKEKSRDFAVRMIKLTEYLNEELHEYVSAEDLLLKGSSIGLLIRKSEYAETSAVYFQKLSKALEYAKLTQTKIRELFESAVIDEKFFRVLEAEISDIISMLNEIISATEIRLTAGYDELPGRMAAHFMLYVLNCKS